MEVQLVLLKEAASSDNSVSRVLVDLIDIQNQRISLLEQNRDERLVLLERRMGVLEDAMKMHSTDF